MEWERKVEMVELGNRIDRDKPETKAKFQAFVLGNIDTFDSQSWEMFCEFVEIVPDSMKNDIDFWKVVYQRIKKVNFDSMCFRPSLRISLIQTICEDDFNIK